MSSSAKGNSAVKWSALKGRAVVDLISARRIGSVDDLVLELRTRRVVGLKFKPGLFTADQIVPVEVTEGFGGDVVTLRLEGVLQGSLEEQALSKLPTLTQVIGNSVVTVSGKLVGNINDVLLSLEPLEISGYEISEGGLFAKKHVFQVTSEVNYGPKLVTIPDALVDTATPAS